jgi:hypothetical protein
MLRRLPGVLASFCSFIIDVTRGAICHIQESESMVWYNRGKLVLLQDSHADAIALSTDTVKAALMKTTYSIDIDAHHGWTDVSASEISATSYVAGGGTLGSKAFEEDDTNDRAEFTAADTVFAAIGNGGNDTFDQIIIYSDTPAGKPLIAHSTVTSTDTNGGDVTLQWNAEGILQVT